MRARRTDPITSNEAGENSANFDSQHYFRILDIISIGDTIYDISRKTDLDANQVARRMKELQKKGNVDLVYDENGKEVVKLGATGRNCRTWKPTI